MAEPALPRLSVLRNTKAVIGNDGGLFVVLLAGNMVASGLGESLLGQRGERRISLLFSPAGDGCRRDGGSAAVTLRSILSLKRKAFQTIRPVVSRKKRGFPLTSGTGALGKAAAFPCPFIFPNKARWGKGRGPGGGGPPSRASRGGSPSSGKSPALTLSAVGHRGRAGGSRRPGRSARRRPASGTCRRSRGRARGSRRYRGRGRCRDRRR